MTSIDIEVQDKKILVCQATVGGVTRQSRHSAAFMIKPLAAVGIQRQCTIIVLLIFQK